MDVSGTLAYLPLTAMCLGAMAGLVVGRYLAGRWPWGLIAVLSVWAVVLIARLAAIQPGNEETAFGPLVWLTGGVLPALFAAIMGTLGGRALRKRARAA